MMMYEETFYGRHMAQHQLQMSKIKFKKGLHLATKNTSGKSETRFDDWVSSYATL